MLKLKKGKPWVFWPSSICSTFPESPGNMVLKGDEDFEITFDLTLTDDSYENKTLFTVLPYYTGVQLQKDNTLVTVTYEDRVEYYTIPLIFKYKDRIKVRFEHKTKQYFKVYLNDKEVVNEILVNRTFGIADSPHIIIGAGNFPKNEFNLYPTKFNLHQFTVSQRGELVAMHNFKEQIFDKFVDETGNLNYIHRL